MPLLNPSLLQLIEKYPWLYYIFQQTGNNTIKKRKIPYKKTTMTALSINIVNYISWKNESLEK